MTVGATRLRDALGSDLPAVEALLRAAELPVAGVSEALGGFLVAEADGRLVAVAGLEVHGGDGILRSVAVEPSRRGRGLGDRLTREVIGRARSAGLRRLYLLTTTAEGYFPRYGFRRIEREAASEDARRSVEFREACPASAVVMELDLRNDAMAGDGGPAER